jgi:hypothetical protein
MPRVPEYGGQQVALSNQPSGRFEAPQITDTASKQLMQFGESMTRTGNAMLDIATNEAHIINEADTKAADNALAEAHRKALHTPDTGYLGTVGKSALDAKDSVVKSLQEERERIEGGLKTEAAKRMFAEVADRRMNQAMSQIDSHAGNQAKAYQIGETSARASNAVNDATVNADGDRGQGSLYSQGKATALHEFEQFAQLKGWGEEQTKEGRLKLLTGLHGQVIGGFIGNGQAAKARDYLSENEKEIDPAKLDDLRKQVKTAGVRDDSLNLFMGMNPSNLSGNKKELSQLYKDGKITAEVYDATMQRAEHGYTVAKAQEAEYDRSMLGKAQKWFVDNPDKTLNDMPHEFNGWATSRARWDDLKRLQHSAMVDAGIKKDITSNPDHVAELNALAELDPDLFVKQKIGAFELSKADRYAFMATQELLGKGGAKAHKEYVSAADQINSVIGGLKVKDKAQQNAIKMYLKSRFDDECNGQVFSERI